MSRFPQPLMDQPMGFRLSLKGRHILPRVYLGPYRYRWLDSISKFLTQKSTAVPKNLQQLPRRFEWEVTWQTPAHELGPLWWSHVGRLWRLRRQSPTESLLEGFKVRHQGSTSCFLSASWMRIHCDEPPHVPATTCVPTVMNYTHNDTPK